MTSPAFRYQTPIDAKSLIADNSDVSGVIAVFKCQFLCHAVPTFPNLLYFSALSGNVTDFMWSNSVPLTASVV
jgi:hypothetical protein